MKSISILMSVLMVFQTFNTLTVIANYELNKESIAELLCVNKDRPQLNCEGRCFLAKKLKSLEQENSAGLPALQVNFIDHFAKVESRLDASILDWYIEPNPLTIYLVSEYCGFLAAIWQPPQ